MKKKFSWLNRNVFGFSIASFFSDANHEIIPLILPRLLKKFVSGSALPEYLGIISGLPTITATISSFFFGWYSDRIQNRKPLILIGYALIGLVLGCLAFVQSWVSILLLLMLVWTGFGMVRAPRDSMVAGSLDPRYYGHAFGFRQAFDNLGSIAGPVLVYFLSDMPLSDILLASFIPGIMALLVIQIFVEEVPHRIVQKKTEKKIINLPHSFYYFLAVILIFGLGNFSRPLLLLRAQDYLPSSYSTLSSVSTVTLLYIFRNIIQTIASYTMGAWSDYIGRTQLLAWLGFFSFGIMALALIAPIKSLLFITAIFFLSGISSGTYISLQKSYTADLLPEELRGTGYGMLQAVNSCGDLLSNLAIGWLWSGFSAEIAFLYAALTSFAATVMLMFNRIKKS